ncbi:hypothetical protein PFICI_02435 [Pestalotiopsis fici W106-1]|uniref:Carboxylesterase type B domain-containing protein n=1 Tax=Pestalotiopsis fici (strain W106-1 / CGMCC3.15140) TaxID=1229662 RepID=W3XED2_PESFW|nr:uncharacterized protein PFICI_02435 [Pestalotiopsis fici W106-1]ETS84410.1 hypothetical protein PFICI_02435 [Pestalotiopsis fici W106-1]
MHSLRALGIGLLAGSGSALCTSRSYDNGTTVGDNSTTPVAVTKNGTYYGVHSSQWHQDYFRGIPYAQPPVGDLRFRNPQPLNTSWEGQRNATEYGHMCYGYGATQFVLGEDVSEDCLTLNIQRASNVSASKGLLPVAVYIHGGLFKHGTGRDPRYDPTSLL